MSGDEAREEAGQRGAPHVPVLLDEVLAALARPGSRWFLDGTLGAGGHAAALLEAVGGSRLLGLDRDPEALALAGERLGALGERVRRVHATFADAADVARREGVGAVDGILLDLGVSSMHLDRPERGFSFQAEGPLDMRMDPTAPRTARDLVEGLREEELADLIYRLGEERHSRRIARAIVEARREEPLTSTARLAEVVRRAVPPPRRGGPRRGGRGRGRPRRLHPATRTFQALRMAVNEELEQLEGALPALFDLLAPGGRLAVISFHSLEDRLVKRFSRERKADGTGRILTKKPLQAGDEEVARNPRARSAKLRVLERASAP